MPFQLLYNIRFCCFPEILFSRKKSFLGYISFKMYCNKEYEKNISLFNFGYVLKAFSSEEEVQLTHISLPVVYLPNTSISSH